MLLVFVVCSEKNKGKKLSSIGFGNMLFFKKKKKKKKAYVCQPASANDL